jgi:hypothetical protein
MDRHVLRIQNLVDGRHVTRHEYLLYRVLISVCSSISSVVAPHHGGEFKSCRNLGKSTPKHLRVPEVNLGFSALHADAGQYFHGAVITEVWIDN